MLLRIFPNREILLSFISPLPRVYSLLLTPYPLPHVCPFYPLFVFYCFLPLFIRSVIFYCRPRVLVIFEINLWSNILYKRRTFFIFKFSKFFFISCSYLYLYFIYILYILLFIYIFILIKEPSTLSVYSLVYK